MGILTESTKRIKESLLREIEAESTTIAADLAARLPQDDGINAELAEMKKPAGPTKEEKLEAQKIQEHITQSLQPSIDSHINQLFDLIDQLYAANVKASSLMHSSSNFFVANYLDSIKGKINGYRNDLTLGRRRPMYRASE